MYSSNYKINYSTALKWNDVCLIFSAISDFKDLLLNDCVQCIIVTIKV